VLPLLDGLDEVKLESRTACVEAINEFRQSHGLLPLLVTSRTADYEALAEALRLHGAIVVRPLTREQLDAYLTELGSTGDPVRLALQEDPSLGELLDSPLLLNVVVACASQGGEPRRVTGTLAERRDQLFGFYVNHTLRRRAAEVRYTSEQIAHRLSWLAYQMRDHGLSVFYLEGLQVDWLPQRQRKSIRMCTRLLFVLVFALGLALPSAMTRGLGLIELAGGVLGVLIFAEYSRPGIRCAETVRWSWSGLRNSLPITVSRVLVGLTITSLGLWLVGGLSPSTVFGLFCGLFCGLFYVLAFGLSFGEIKARTLPNEGIRRSARQAVFVVLVLTVFAGLFFALFFGLVGGLEFALTGGLVIGLCFASSIGVGIGLAAGGDACLKHLVLRLRLIRNGSTPWKYVRFLDHAADRILLRKVGGGYAFIHRMLLDHFAARYVEPAGETPPRTLDPH
jgi:hypothetical protein